MWKSLEDALISKQAAKLVARSAKNSFLADTATMKLNI